MLIAEKRADALLVQGDSEGSSTWVQIANAITQLERNSRSDFQMIH